MPQQSSLSYDNMPARKYLDLAETALGTALATARAGLELYSQWYQKQQESKRLKRKRQELETSCTSAAPEEDCVPPGRRAVGVDSSSDENDSASCTSPRKPKRQKQQTGEEPLAKQQAAPTPPQKLKPAPRPLKLYFVGTYVRKVGYGGLELFSAMHYAV